VFVVNFGEQYYLDQDFTSDVAKLQTALERVETRGSTALYDAIVASAAHMKQGSILQKRILLVVTDGADNASQESLEDAIQQLQQKDGPVVYVIGLLANGRNASSTTRSLDALSQSTGGTAFFPKEVSQVDSITRSIASAIRNQYVIGYKSSSTATGHTYHTIQVDAFDPGRRKLRVRTRTGYYSDSAVDAAVPPK
jgi:Ca-activated chloride channel homolog